MKYSTDYLRKLEKIIRENNYTLRHEKGNFKSGYCLLKDSKVIVLNQFATLESRINTLIEILKELKGQEPLTESAHQELERIEKLSPAGKRRTATS
jgi:hypothetical protein